jgi:hypothetical protein
MTTDLHEELAVPHFEDRLWGELARTHGAPRDREHRDRVMTGRRSQPRRRRSIAVSVASIAAAAAVVAGVVILGDSDRGTAPRSESATGEPGSVDLAAEIVTATRQATAESVVHVFQDSTTIPDGEAWTDETSGTRRDLFYDVAGDPAYDSGALTAPAPDATAPELPDDPTDPSWPLVRSRVVDHCFGEYAEIMTGALHGGTEAERVGRRLAEGALVEDGTQVVDGRELIRLIEVPAPIGQGVPQTGEVWVEEEQLVVEGDAPEPTTTTTEAPASTEPVRPEDIDESLVEHIYLVDPETYRPMMILGYQGTDAEYTMTFEYLPRTPENLELLVTPIPDGFVQVDELRGDGERFEAGCS